MFIRNYADKCESLYRLKKKGAKFNWSTEAQDSFDKIKRALTEAPVLQLPNFTEQLNLFTDASGVGIGSVLNQNHRHITFASRTLNKMERNYIITERECFAVIWALNEFKTYFGSMPVKFNIEWEHQPGIQNVVANVLSRNPVGNLDGSQIACAALRALTLNSREQVIQEQREYPELGHIYRYLEHPNDGSVNATVCEGWSQDFKIIDGLLFYAKYFITLGELRVYIPRSLRETIMKKFHDLLLAGHLGKRKTYLKLCDTCYIPYMRKYIFGYVSTCDRCQKFNYKNALPAGRLISIVSNYPNEIVTLDLLGTYPTSRPERYRFLLVINDHFTKWSELFPLRKASAQAIANALFEHYIPRYGAPISLISDNDPQFISEVFEHLSHMLDIKHMKTGSEHRNQERPTPEPKQGIKKAIPSSVSSRNYKYRRPNNPSQGSQSFAGPSDLRNGRQAKPHTEGSKHDMTGQYNKARETRTTTSGTNRAAESRPVRSKQATAVKPCPYYLRSRVR
ncbi:transposon Tf2-6 polyprotein [Trichonephila clavipes]|nr:transposon Tf2-6 polyprotein [Trichonephila clavipes]